MAERSDCDESFSCFVFSYLQHVHVHVLPRKPGDFERNDSIYDEVTDGTFTPFGLLTHLIENDLFNAVQIAV